MNYWRVTRQLCSSWGWGRAYSKTEQLYSVYISKSSTNKVFVCDLYLPFAESAPPLTRASLPGAGEGWARGCCGELGVCLPFSQGVFVACVDIPWWTLSQLDEGVDSSLATAARSAAEAPSGISPLPRPVLHPAVSSSLLQQADN